ncbi:MAG: right-handed parallel beta-helix repeat-containing protein [Deltaproteobacteria bacterium]|nr:right-handed parallel beta-helix repeat-containing protein [Deltaproteobacteria bacterium]
MKNLFRFGLLSLILTLPSFVYPIDSVCDGVDIIPITDRNRSAIQTALTNYKIYSCLNNTAYCLCFQFNLVSQTTSSLNLSLDTTASDKPVYISGLQINGLAGPLVIKGSQPVMLIDTHFACTANTPSPQPSSAGGEGGSIGIQLTGNGHQILGSDISNCAIGVQVEGNATTIRDSHIACSAKSGVGIKLTGDRHAISDTETKDCNIGVQIDGSDNSLTRNTIHDNNTGVKIANGSGNFVERNIIYKNDANGDGEYKQTEGIFLADGVNGGVLPPAILNISGSIAQQDDPILTYSSDISYLPAEGEPPVMASFQFQLPYPKGEIEVGLTETQYDRQQNEDTRNRYSYQPREFYAFTVNCLELENLRTESLRHFSCDLPMTSVQKNQKAVILFHHPIFGSTSYSARVLLNGPSSIPAGPVSTPVETSGLTGGVGNLPPPFSSAETGTSKEEKSGQVGNSMTGVQLASGGLTTTGASGGLGGCGASLNPDQGGDSGAFLLLLFTSFTGLLVVRIRKTI